jgi:hypothetical protein
VILEANTQLVYDQVVVHEERSSEDIHQRVLLLTPWWKRWLVGPEYTATMFELFFLQDLGLIVSTIRAGKRVYWRTK